MFTVRIKPSRCLAVLLAAAHLAASALLWPLALALWLKAAIAAALIVSLAFHLRRYALLAASASIVGIEIGEDGHCALQTRGGAQLEARLLGSSFVMPYLTVLNFKPAGSRIARHMTILPDSLGADEFRRLRVWLRWKVDWVEDGHDETAGDLKHGMIKP